MFARLNSCRTRGQSQLQLWHNFICRGISTELANALRPFYFAVHPDLFGQHPTQRNVNEDSLKQLSAHMELLHERKFNVLQEAKTLQFYIRDTGASSRNTFKLIKITLDTRTTDPRAIIERLLNLCNLSTDYVKSIKPTATTSSFTSGRVHTDFQSASNFRAGQDYKYGSEFKGFEQKYYQAKEEVKKTLDEWIIANASLAKQRADELAGLKEEVLKLQKTLVKRLGLQDARYDCGWNFGHYRGCLKSLERLADLHESNMGALKGRVLVFATFTGISLEGHVMLYTADVQSNWLDFIKNIPMHDQFLQKIPQYENTLSQVLRNIKIGRRKFMPKQQAREYAAHLTKVTTTLGDYLTTNKFPKSWPATLKDYEIVIESESGPLMVNPTGQLIAPATCPGFLLIDFITTNLKDAKERMETYNKQKEIEFELTEKCTKQLQLTSLTKDDSVTPDKMIQTINKLLAYDATHFGGIALHITNYYSVLSDGIVCIPWDFTRS